MTTVLVARSIRFVLGRGLFVTAKWPRVRKALTVATTTGRFRALRTAPLQLTSYAGNGLSDASSFSGG